MKCRNRIDLTAGAVSALLVLAVSAFLVLALAPAPASAGAFIFADEDFGLDVITHPSGYNPNTGGVAYVEACVDASAQDASAIEIPARNIAKQINLLQAATPNLFFGNNNDIPANAVDFESLTLHEFGHCIGLGHPNLGVQPGVESGDEDYTASGQGGDEMFSVDAGTDGVIGSSDDQRGDDPNLHWFVPGVNNPFLDVANPDASNYSRDLADLPGSHNFVANADRSVGAQLGFSNTEAVMQQGQFFDEDQRQLQADDVATLHMGMSGLDEANGGVDDYTIRMIYGGIRTDTSDCDIVVLSDDEGFGVCSVSASPLSATHWRIEEATFTYNHEMNWYFNQVPNPTCSAGNDDLSFSSVQHNNVRYHEACDSITYGPGYTVGSSGRVTAIAPSVSLGPNTSIQGVFRVLSVTP